MSEFFSAWWRLLSNCPFAHFNSVLLSKNAQFDKAPLFRESWEKKAPEKQTNNLTLMS